MAGKFMAYVLTAVMTLSLALPPVYGSAADAPGQTEAAEQIGTAEQTEAAGTATVNDGAYYYRAVCRAASGDLDGAIADYTTCIDHGYELAQTYYARAQVYAARGDTENQKLDLQNSLKYAG